MRQDKLKSDMQATVEGIKALAEADQAASMNSFPKLRSGVKRQYHMS